MRDGQSDSDHQGAGFAREALELAPDDAEAWGVLALAPCNVANHVHPQRIGGAVRECESAARRALSLDAEQADALAALAILPPTFGDWLAAERRFASGLGVDPSSFFVLSELGMLRQSVGRCRDAVATTRDLCRSRRTWAWPTAGAKPAYCRTMSLLPKPWASRPAPAAIARGLCPARRLFAED